MSINVITDSTCYIPEELIRRYNISVVSLNVLLDDKSYREVDLDNFTFYDSMKRSKHFPKSSQPSLDELYGAFEKATMDGDSAIGVFLSSDMSGTYSSAHLAKSMLLEKNPLAKVEIIDSRSNCMQLGYTTLAAAKAAYAGKSLEAALKVAKDVINNSRFLFVPATLEYLKMGGRIGNASALIGSLFDIKPILTVKDGKTSVYQKVRTTQKAIDRIIEAVLDAIKENGLGEVIVHHINCEEAGKKVAARLAAELGINVGVCPIGPVIGTHVGPGAIGVAYYTRTVYNI
jgi:DegV family protein with EDD domain